MNEETETLKLRVFGNSNVPTLVYIPGLHGDWTLVRGFRDALKGRVRFVEMTYPRTLAWSLDDYAANIERALIEQGITGGWLLGESFGSQVTWAIAARGKFKIEGIILAGGFVRHPTPRMVSFLHFLMPKIPKTILRLSLRVYAKIAPIRFRKSPVMLESFKEFIARRTRLDWQAMTHRMRLIKENDPGPIASKVTLPVYALTGSIDPVVPWAGVRPWLEKNCPGFRGSRVIVKADHVVLATGATAAAEQVLQWMSVKP